MSETSRRKFLAAAGAGAGTVAVAGVTRSAGAAAAAESTEARPGSATEPVVAFVEDPHSGVVHLMVGDREVVVDDRELANRIRNAAGGN